MAERDRTYPPYAPERRVEAKERMDRIEDRLDRIEELEEKKQEQLDQMDKKLVELLDIFSVLKGGVRIANWFAHLVKWLLIVGAAYTAFRMGIKDWLRP